LTISYHGNRMLTTYVAKQWKKIGFLNRNLRACSKLSKELSYQQFVLPILDYAASVWDPYHQGNINKLEMIQHTRASFVLNHAIMAKKHSVSFLLQSLNWPTLQIHRVCSHIIINQIIQILAHYLPTRSPITTTRTRNDMKFFHYQPSIDCFKYSFFPRIIPEWNKLPQYIVNADSIESFKELLNGHYNIMYVIARIWWCLCISIMPLVGPANHNIIII